jgi:hypothetical protein
VISPRGTSSNSNNSSSNSSNSNNSSSNSSGRPASRVAGKYRAPSECNPLFSISLFIVPMGLNPSFACQGFLPHCSQGRASPTPGCCHRGSATGLPCSSWGSGSSGANVKRHRSGGGGPNCSDGYRRLNDGDAIEYTIGSGGGGPNAPTPAIEGDAGGASSSIPPPTLEETEVVFGRRLRSDAEPEAAPVPLPRVLSRAHQALHETEAAILREWEALEAEHQRLSDWRTQLEERTKAASRQFASERSELERDHKDYRRDLQKVYAWELEASRKEKKLARREEALS